MKTYLITGALSLVCGTYGLVTHLSPNPIHDDVNSYRSELEVISQELDKPIKTLRDANRESYTLSEVAKKRSVELQEKERNLMHQIDQKKGSLQYKMEESKEYKSDLTLYGSALGFIITCKLAFPGRPRPSMFTESLRFTPQEE